MANFNPPSNLLANLTGKLGIFAPKSSEIKQQLVNSISLENYKNVVNKLIADCLKNSDVDNKIIIEIIKNVNATYEDFIKQDKIDIGLWVGKETFKAAMAKYGIKEKYSRRDPTNLPPNLVFIVNLENYIERPDILKQFLETISPEPEHINGSNIADKIMPSNTAK